MSGYGGVKDFSVDAQRRMFVEAQERERQAAENKKASRKIAKATAGASGVALSGMMANLEGGGTGLPQDRKARMAAGDDDDDSIADDWSLDSEESFYVGIERADYAQPDNLEMYGEGKEDDYLPKEDLLGISRVSVAITNREGKEGWLSSLDWDADVTIHTDKGSSLHEFMNGSGDPAKVSKSKRGEGVVARPIVGVALEWDDEGKLDDADDDGVDQVYQHKAAEGKAFIDKFVGAKGESTVADPASMAAASGAGARGSAGGNYPVIAPMALFSPGLSAPAAGSGGAEAEHNGVRQMREREIRRESVSKASGSAKKAAFQAAAAAAAPAASKKDDSAKLRAMKMAIARNKGKDGMVDAAVLMKKLTELMAE